MGSVVTYPCSCITGGIFTVKLEKNIMKFQITIDRDEDGVWIVECPAIPGCISQGYTRAEAIENITEAIRLCLEVRAEIGVLV